MICMRIDVAETLCYLLIGSDEAGAASQSIEVHSRLRAAGAAVIVY